jgi:hypothetical protein
MVTFYMVAIAALSSGLACYVLGASKEWEKHRRTIVDYNDLAAYSNEISAELFILRTAGDENAVGSRHPSLVRRSHLQLVK